MPYSPGNEPENLKKYLNLLLKELNEQFPDGLIVMDMWNHERWDKIAGYLTKGLGYPNGRAFLNAYGFDIADNLETVPEPEPIVTPSSRSAKANYDSGSDKRASKKSAKTDYEPPTQSKPQKGMVFCKECGARISKKAKVCPHCGARRKKSFLGRLLLAIVFILIFIIAIAALFSKSNIQKAVETVSNAASNTSISSNGENLLQSMNNTMSNNKLEEVVPPAIATGDFGFKTINGSMKNISGKTLSYASLTFALYDKDGAQIGTAIANINNLTADSVWKYSASPLTTEDWSRFELTEMQAW